MNTTLFIGIAILVGLVVLAFVIPQSRFLLMGFPVERVQGADAQPVNEEQVQPDAIRAMLLSAGVSEEPLLGDTGVSGHMARLKAGEVTGETLVQYAGNLVALTEATAALGQPIPVPFWDVDTDELRSEGWTAYRIAAALNSSSGAPFLTALGTAYARFHRFKTQAEDGTDTALDTALDLFEPMITLLDVAAPDDLLERSSYITSREHAALYLWQDILVGSSRRNPLSRQKIFDHGFTRRFHMGTIWQYQTGKALEDPEIWGVSGFAPEFVGPPENKNQIEHMSISIVVQGVLREPMFVLDAFENVEQLSGMASADEAAADEALNRAIRDVFLPVYETDLSAAIETLRVHLRGD